MSKLSQPNPSLAEVRPFTGMSQVNPDAAGVFISLRLPSMDPGQAKRDEHRYSYSPIHTQPFSSRKIVLLRALYVIAKETEWMRQRPLPR